MGKDDIINESTTMHIKKLQDIKFNALMHRYFERNLVRSKKVDFFDKVLEIMEKEINAMPQKAVVDGKVVYTPVQ